MRKRLPVLAALLGGAAIALVVLLLASGDGDAQDDRPVASVLQGGSRLDGPQDAFSLRYPKGWRRLTAADLGGKGDRPLSALRRGDGSATVMVQQGGRLEQGIDAIAPGLTRSLARSVKDFRFVRSSTIELPAGRAVSYTFVRTKSRRVQNLVVVPGKARTFTINSVMGGDAKGAAQELAAIVKSFETKG